MSDYPKTFRDSIPPEDQWSLPPDDPDPKAWQPRREVQVKIDIDLKKAMQLDRAFSDIRSKYETFTMPQMASISNVTLTFKNQRNRAYWLRSADDYHIWIDASILESEQRIILMRSLAEITLDRSGAVTFTGPNAV